MQLREIKERGTTNARQHVKRFVCPPPLLAHLAPLLPHAHHAQAPPLSASGDASCALAPGPDARALSRDAAGPLDAAAGATALAGAGAEGTAMARRSLTGAGTSSAATAGQDVAAVAPHVPMPTALLRARRTAMLLAQAEREGFLLQHECRYVWFEAAAAVRSPIASIASA